MILQKEIAEIAEKQGVTKSTIDKDWVLGHFINAIYSMEDLKNVLIFKGGTCLRKCYIENYRFSEDLDFTADESFVLNEDILKVICETVSNNSGVKLHIHSLKPLKYKDQKTGYQAEIKFWGADHSKNQMPTAPERWQTKIKIESILFEKMLFERQEREIMHLYSDQNIILNKAICYDLKEVLCEKMRAMIQRPYTAPRDYYDTWYLLKNFTFNWEEIKKGFIEKMEFKNLIFEGIDQMINEKLQQKLKQHWHNNLGSHLPKDKLPNIEIVLLDLDTFFKEIF